MGFTFLDHAGPMAMAHRGGSLEAPENSWLALQRAVDDLGYRYIETDVHLTTDGRVALLHDATLDRTTDQQGPVAQAHSTRLAEAVIHGPNGETSQGIPLLDEVLDRWPDVRFNIDTKDNAVVEPLAELLLARAAIDRVCIGSFHADRVKRSRQLLGPTLCTVSGVTETARLRLASFGAPVFGKISGACLEIPTGAKLAGPVVVPLVDRRLIEAAHRRGLAVIVWTVDDETEMHRLLDLGVDGLITDRPTVLRDVLAARRCDQP